MGLKVTIKKKLPGFTLEADWSIGNELAVLLGHSGAGKSLTLQMIAGLIKPDNGHIELNGRTLYNGSFQIDLSPQERSFGYVFQDLALFPHMNIRGNILYGAHGVPKQEREFRADSMMNRFKLCGLEQKLPSEVSGGQKQRAALARALIRKPGALLLDEPFSALDSRLREEMQRFLKELCREFPVPVLFVTHDLREARTLADRVIEYEQGRVVQAPLGPWEREKPADELGDCLHRTQSAAVNYYTAVDRGKPVMV